MPWTSEVTVDALDTATFFLATPDLIGRSRLEHIDRNFRALQRRLTESDHSLRIRFGRWREFMFNAMAAIIVPIMLCGAVLEKFFPAQFQTYWLHGPFITPLVNFTLSGAGLIFALYMIPKIVRVLLWISGVLARRQLTGLMLVAGALVFCAARMIAFVHHWNSP